MTPLEQVAEIYDVPLTRIHDNELVTLVSIEVHSKGLEAKYLAPGEIRELSIKGVLQ